MKKWRVITNGSEFHFGVKKMPWNKIEVMAAQHYECAKRCFTVHLQMVNIMLCEF